MDQRIALYVYSKSTITVAPNGTIDFMKMAVNDFSASLVSQISSSTTFDVNPGVYGFIWNTAHGVTAPSSVTIVTDDYDVARKNPWPSPPPPPPPPFVNNNKYGDHVGVFLVPLGATFDLGAVAEPADPTPG